MFSQASVILFTGVCVCIPACTGTDTPLGQNPPPTATAADGTHPTGMHSCFEYIFALRRIRVFRFLFSVSVNRPVAVKHQSFCTCSYLAAGSEV